MALNILYAALDDLSQPSAASINTSARIAVLTAMGHRVTLICGGAPAGLHGGVTIRVIQPATGPLRGMIQRRRLAQAVREALVGGRFDWLMQRGLLEGPARAAMKLGVPAVAECHGFLADELRATGSPRWRVALALRRETRAVACLGGIIALDPTIQSRIVETWPQMAGRCTMVPNGVDLSRFPLASPEEAARHRAALNVPGHATLLCFFGRVWDIYRFDGLIDAMKADPSLWFVVAGDGPAQPALKTLIEREGVSGRASLLGRVSPGRVHELLAAADIALMPSIPGMEGLHLKVFECAAAGIPLLASACDDLSFVPREGLGHLARDTGAAAILAGIKTLRDSGAISRSQRERRRTYAGEHFSWESRMHDILHWMETLRP